MRGLRPEVLGLDMGMSQRDRREIMHVDMDAFFASAEQLANPALRGEPVGVIGGGGRTVVVTASYEARALGVKTGMNRFEASRVCPSLIFVIANNRMYIDISVRVMEILKRFSPLVEAYSIDEAFLDLTGTEALFGDSLTIGRGVREGIRSETGLTASVGIGPNKLVAKLASSRCKPDGICRIGEESLPGILEDLPVGKLWGIGRRGEEALKAMGLGTCGALGRAPVQVLRTRFGIRGEVLKLMGQGRYSSSVEGIKGTEEVEDEGGGGEPFNSKSSKGSKSKGDGDVKSIGHSLTLPSDIYDRSEAERYLLLLSHKVGERARRHKIRGRKVSITVRSPDFKTITRAAPPGDYTNDTGVIYRRAVDTLAGARIIEGGKGLRLIGVTLSDLSGTYCAPSLFGEDRSREALLQVLDSVNGTFGSGTLLWGSLFSGSGKAGGGGGGNNKGALESKRGGSGRGEGERGGTFGKGDRGVISPSWRPTGVKRIDVK